MKKKMPSLTKFIIFSFSVIIIYTIAVTILTAVTGQDFSAYYMTFCGVFGCSETLSCAIIKIYKLKNEN